MKTESVLAIKYVRIIGIVVEPVGSTTYFIFGVVKIERRGRLEQCRRNIHFVQKQFTLRWVCGTIWSEETLNLTGRSHEDRI